MLRYWGAPLISLSLPDLILDVSSVTAPLLSPKLRVLHVALSGAAQVWLVMSGAMKSLPVTVSERPG